MSEDIFHTIIRDSLESDLPELVERDLSIAQFHKLKPICVIGPRRAGKTYFLFNIMKRLENVPKSLKLYINLEDDRLRPLDLRVLDGLLKAYYAINPGSKEETLHLFLDELQNIDGWEAFVRRIVDTENVQVYFSGSSSKLLSKEIATSMRGRAITYSLLPFSFSEVLRVKGLAFDEFNSSAKKAILRNELVRYVDIGGFPEVVMEDNKANKIRLVREYLEVMLMRDIVERHSISNIKLLRLVFNALMTSYSKEFSAHKYYKFLKSEGYSVSKNTIYEYVQHFEDAFSLFLIKRYSTSLREREQSLPKVYPIDNSYVHLTVSPKAIGLGRLLESTVAIHLLRLLEANPVMTLHYWKGTNGLEVDFVLLEKDEVLGLVQVCYDARDLDTRKRELKSLITAAREFECSKLWVITMDEEGEEDLDGFKVRFVPVWNWMLGFEGPLC